MPVPYLGDFINGLIIIGLLIFAILFFVTYKATGSLKSSFIFWGVFLGIPFLILQGMIFHTQYENAQEHKKYQEKQAAFLAKSVPYFENKCKSAGIFIYDKNIPSQESVYIMKPMKADTSLPYKNRQYIKHDFFNHPFFTDAFIDGSIDKMNASILKNYPFFQKGYYFTTHGFDYVEFVDEESNLLRVSYIPEPVPYDYKIKRLIKEPIDKVASRYGITWEDISTKEDRDHWVAGGKRQIIDLQTKRVVAEVIGYVMATNPNREYKGDWKSTKRCPERYSPTDFLYSVLKNKEYLEFEQNLTENKGE